MKTGVHFVPLVPSAETLRSRGRSEKQIEELQLQAAADSEKEVRQMELKFPSIFSCLMTSLSSESRSAVELDGIFPTLEAVGDPLPLWNLILKIHELGGVSGSVVWDRAEARMCFEKINMSDFEELAVFKQRFDDAYKNYVHYGNNQMNESDNAWRFLGNYIRVVLGNLLMRSKPVLKLQNYLIPRKLLMWN